jgi:hypothetical protein
MRETCRNYKNFVNRLEFYSNIGIWFFKFSITVVKCRETKLISMREDSYKNFLYGMCKENSWKLLRQNESHLRET